MIKDKLVAEALDEAERVREMISTVTYPTVTELALVTLANRIYELQNRITDNYFGLDDE